MLTWGIHTGDAFATVIASKRADGSDFVKDIAEILDLLKSGDDELKTEQVLLEFILLSCRLSCRR